jgi:hypothetical protein
MLSKLSIPEVVSYVNSWKPNIQNGIGSPSLDGLAETFENLIAKNPISCHLTARGCLPMFAN